MDFATVLVVAQNLLAALQSSQLKEICCILGYRCEFGYFYNTVSAVRVVLLDVSVKQELPHEIQLWIEELKDLVYKADDLLEKFVTLAEQKQLIEGGKVSEEVCLFFSRFDLSGVTSNMSEGARKIREKLDTVASNQNLLGFSVDYLPIRRRKEGIHSFVCEDKIFGREEDVAKIVDVICDSNVQQDVSFLTVVGAGGIGKTALARLVYDEERVSSAFSIKLWGCVSDIDQHQFDVNQILEKILRTAAGCKFNGFTDQMPQQLLELVEGRKFLLVLDDVWTENRDQWLKMVEFFKAGKKGSWIVVTTRSRETTKVIGSGPIYELQGLSEENSWSLFEKMAFEQAHPLDDFVKVGRMIVKDCAGVPLAIRVVGSLLYGQDKSKWLSFQDIVESANIRECKNIEPLLKLSYKHLEFSLKSCFSCCAIFPKDSEIEKELLISIWMAQGYIIPLDKSQSTEDAGEEHFSILFWRCFLQDVQFDKYGAIISCKVHALMHDIAQEIVGKEFYATHSIASDMDKKVHHHSIINRKYTGNSFSKPCIRGYLHVGRMDQVFTDQVLKRLTCLRALVLRDSGLQILPDAITKMLHLRCLDLSENSNLEVLPKSFTNLCNLESLILRSCIRLKELPQDLSKLVKLRVLDVEGCSWLDSLPSNMGMLTCLHTLTKYSVEVSSRGKQCFYQLKGLKALQHLKGYLDIYIRFPKNPKYARQHGMEGSYLRSKDGLKKIRFILEHVENHAGLPYEEALLDDMQPHSNLKELMFLGYQGVIMPGWAKDGNLATIFPHMVRLQLSNCVNLKYLPILGSLCHLRFLSLYKLPCLEYMDVVAESGAVATEQSFFPRLEELCLSDLPNLKGWFIDAASFPQLRLLRIDSCPEMASLLLCPSMEDLQLLQFNRRLQIRISESQDETRKVCSSSYHSSSLLESRDTNMKQRMASRHVRERFPKNVIRPSVLSGQLNPFLGYKET